MGAMLIGGCGGPQSETAQVRSIVERYERALVSGNGSELCSLLSTEARRYLATLAAPISASPHGTKTGGCAGFASLFSYAIARNPKALSRIEVARIDTPRVVGNRARVIVREPEAAREINLAKTQSGWRITLPPPETATSFDLRGEPAAVGLEPPRSVVLGGGQTASQFYLGRSVVGQSGCLACHRIGEAGNAGPGSDLTDVGSRRSSAAIERVIIAPIPPMPSFRHLPRAKLRALVTFLSLLRGQRGGGVIDLETTANNGAKK